MCNIGVSQEERAKKQNIVVDAELFLNIRNASATDDIKQAVNYSEIHSLIKKIAEKKEYKLIEALAENIAEEILKNYQVKKVIIHVKKPMALAKKNVKYAAVEITRTNMVKVYLGLGANLGNKLANIKEAIRQLKKNLKITNISPIYKTDPIGYGNQDWFLNCVVEAETEIKPLALLKLAKCIEKKLKRTETIKYGPRTMDIDILFYGNKVISGKNLQIPHPRMHRRLFVLEPFAKINQDFFHPKLKKTIRELKKKIKINNGVELYRKKI